MATAYHTVLGSLPHLPHFQRAERLPLTRLRLEQRVGMLPEAQARQIWQAEALVSLRQAVARHASGGDWLRRWRRTLPAITEPRLREYVEYRRDQQLILAALRLRHQGLGPETEAEIWSISPRGRKIQDHWHDGDFRLAALYPWLVEARSLLERQDARELERLLMDACWQKLNRIGDSQPLGFGKVVAFVFQWDIVNAWLAHDPVQASERFKQLMGEIQHAQ
ncbi:hypothetical protein MIN45_P0938 [Methylomarinovum tepidoasis]|uniref:Uncharacterized protein n=1 Tax=Methylomarinovum tepidoasis TaxID=2840183 RepID=A0AAU9D0R4_9GAMM|nr:DUF2764 family protein [Methylomarinovum sp. IN45]BCX88569.1 hypothetical protein MIN45_P0938 [Methylomarinovum sp. IN45]